MTALGIEADYTVTDENADLSHLVYCNDDTALCGLDVSGSEWASADEDGVGCVVCDDLSGHPCSDPDCPARDP